MVKRVVFGLIILIFILGVIYLIQPEKGDCKVLEEKFDEIVSGSNGVIPARYGLPSISVLLGGTLIKIEDVGPNRSGKPDLYAYKLHFKGEKEEAYLYLMTTVGNILPYEESNFYVFDQEGISKSGMHSGEFNDREMTDLKKFTC